MTKYKANFEALDKENWADFEGRVAKISEEDLQNNASAIDELERLRRVIEFVVASIDSLQPFVELINPDIQNHVKSFENYLRNLETSHPQQKLNSLSNLNNTATLIVERVSPFLSRSQAAQSAGQAFARYRELIEKEEEDIGAMRSEADEALSVVRSIYSDFTGYRDELLGGANPSESIKAEIEAKLTEINEMLRKTETFYRRLTEGDEYSGSIQNQIVQAQERAAEASYAIEEKLHNTENNLNELDRVYSDVIGIAADGEEQKQGLKSQLEDRQQQLQKMADEFEEKFNGLANEIEGLLPGATSAGLATAYSQLRSSAEAKTQRYSVAFFGLVGVLTLTAAATVTQSISISPPSWQAIEFSSTADYFSKLLFKLPVIAPVLWAALTVSKRRSEQHRLAEEYSHKEALAKSYEGFKQQIVEIDREDNELLPELLEAMLKAVSLNAAKTLDGKHGEKMPVQEAVEEAMKQVAAKMGSS